MKIISLQAENIKKLVAIEIKPNGNMVEITGKNGQGKTSVLDSIWWALTGTSHIQAAPIRKGADEARIRLDLGELKVTRTFRRKGDSSDVTTSISVENAEGARFPSPQKMLDTLLGALSFDPLEFARMEPKKQFDALRRFVPDVDFQAIENANRGDFERRTEVNRFAKQERAAAVLIQVPTNTPIDEIDEAELVHQLEAAGEENANTERRKARRQSVSDRIQQLQASAARADSLVEDAKNVICEERDAIINENGRQMRELQEQIKQLHTRLNEASARIDHARVLAETKMAAEERRLREVATVETKEAEDLQAQLTNAGPLPPPVDTAVLKKRIDEARAVNANVRLLGTKSAHQQRAARLEKESEDLTESMRARDEAKLAAIAAAKMPVKGIDFGDGMVLLNGVPFEQASDAEQLRASVAIAMALNPKLRVIRIRDGSLLDGDAMKLLAEMADKHDMQCWIERVDASGTVGFILEDGHVRKAARQEGAAA
jgi:ABC-type cobalamin/Fe3+-siderophores transport system ATPase subunit